MLYQCFGISDGLSLIIRVVTSLRIALTVRIVHRNKAPLLPDVANDDWSCVSFPPQPHTEFSHDFITYSDASIITCLHTIPYMTQYTTIVRNIKRHSSEGRGEPIYRHAGGLTTQHILLISCPYIAVVLLRILTNNAA